MGLLPKKWLKRIGILFGLAAVLTPALLDLGWIPRSQAQSAILFLLGFMILDGAAKESGEPVRVPELITRSDDFVHAAVGLISEAKHEVMIVVRGEDFLAESVQPWMRKMFATMRKEKQLHVYAIVAAPISGLSEESFQRRFAIERDPSLDDRYHYRFADIPVSFGCQVFDQRHWSLDFTPNPAEPVSAGIFFRDDPEGARLIGSFIRHQYLERPGVTMSLSEAYEKWKTLQSATARAE